MKSIFSVGIIVYFAFSYFSSNYSMEYLAKILLLIVSNLNYYHVGSNFSFVSMTLLHSFSVRPTVKHQAWKVHLVLVIFYVIIF